MHLFTLCAAFALPILVPAFEHAGDVYIPLEARQEPGTPKYACHEDCGTVISLSKKDGFCDNKEFTTSLSDCLDCALEFDIWKYYQSGVSKAAEACGLDADPKESDEEPEPEEPETTKSELPTSETAAPTSTTEAAETSDDVPAPTPSEDASTSSEEDVSAPETTSVPPPAVTATGGVTPSGTAPGGNLPSGNTTVVSPTASSTEFPPEHSGAAGRVGVAAQGIFAVVLSGLMLV